MTLTSTIPAERGMGSSAKNRCGHRSKPFDYFDYAYTYQELFELVSLSEKIAHGNPSGIDAAATSGADPLFLLEDFRPHISR